MSSEHFQILFLDSVKYLKILLKVRMIQTLPILLVTEEQQLNPGWCEAHIALESNPNLASGKGHRDTILCPLVPPHLIPGQD